MGPIPPIPPKLRGGALHVPLRADFSGAGCRDEGNTGPGGLENVDTGKLNIVAPRQPSPFLYYLL